MTAKTGNETEQKFPRGGVFRIARTAQARALALLAVLTLLIGAATLSPASATEDKVLILDGTVYDGQFSSEASYAQALGFAVDVVDAATWGSMTTAEFAGYRAIILGDPFCFASDLATPAANATTWASAVTGNVIVIGTDPNVHPPGGIELTTRGIDFAVADPSGTGAYITLSCNYHGTVPNTPVPALDGFGSFTVKGVGCHNTVKVVATHPALSSLTDANLSNWHCSVHEAFDSWPLSFEVFAMSVGTGADFTAPDGTTGTPYILARGVEVISDIKLSPVDATNPIGTSHMVTATVNEAETPVEGATVTFTVIDGPHIGETGAGTTGADGIATFSYTGTVPGIDTIEATFVDSLSRTQRSNRVSMTWEPDDDGDGVPDDDDDCVNTPIGEPVDANGCPLPPIEWTLDVTNSGGSSGGSGGITGQGIACPGDCTETYVDGTQVTLTGTATGGSSFAGWSQDCSGMSTCDLTMSADRLATGTFDAPSDEGESAPPSGGGATGTGPVTAPTQPPPAPPSLPGDTCRGRAVTIQASENQITFGTAGNDVINGTEGNDTIYGYGRRDIICGRGGDDTLYGGGGGGGGLFADRLYGGAGQDHLFGDGGDDTMVGGPGDDFLYGRPGNDGFNGGAGIDACIGGPGLDIGKLCEPFDQ